MGGGDLQLQPDKQTRASLHIGYRIEYFLFFTQGFPWPLPVLRCGVFPNPNAPPPPAPSGPAIHWHWQELLVLLGVSPSPWTMVQFPDSLSDTRFRSPRSKRHIFIHTCMHFEHFRICMCNLCLPATGLGAVIRVALKGRRPLSQLSTWPAAPARQSPFFPPVLWFSFSHFPTSSFCLSFQEFSQPNFGCWEQPERSVALCEQWQRALGLGHLQMSHVRAF